MIRVFVSSVSVGLEAIRAQIIVDLHTANFDVGAMERFGAQPQAPIDVCLREVRKAGVVVLLIGPRYGSLLPQGISYTHAEFRAAQGAGLPILAFRIPCDSDLASDERDRLDSFVTEVASTAIYDALSPAESLERLSTKVQIALSSAKDRGDLGHRFSVFQKYEPLAKRVIGRVFPAGGGGARDGQRAGCSIRRMAVTAPGKPATRGFMEPACRL